MSLAQAPSSDRGTAPLMSNNPFRNRIAQNSSARPTSTNPFLDAAEVSKAPSDATIKPVPSDGAHGTAELLTGLSLDEKPPRSPQKSARQMDGSRRSENLPPPYSARSARSGHRPGGSQEERRRQMGRRPAELDIFADPVDAKSRSRRPRRNSDTSVMERASVLLDPDDAKKEQSRSRRDTKRPGTTKAKPGRKLDVIDKLDLTSIYGTGLFHHDGPFDACNPNRNRRRHKLAPMQAFPKDSENMKIGGSGPLNSKLDYDKFHGLGREAHTDFNHGRHGQGQAVVDTDAAYFARPAPDRATSFNATDRVEPVHADETAGLGTSTFLEGAPASRAAIERRDSEFEQQAQTNGLSRKKSLAQKIRGVRSSRPALADADRNPTSPPATGQSDSVVNPFFKDYDKEYEQKGQQVASYEQEVSTGRPRAPSSPKPTGTERPDSVERPITAGGTGATTENKPSGLLGRMKSLKKTKSKYERREPS